MIKLEQYIILTLEGNDTILFFSSFETEWVIVVKAVVIDEKETEKVTKKIAEAINNKNPVYQIARALRNKEE